MFGKLKLVMFAIMMFGISGLDSPIAAAQKSECATIVLDNNQNQVVQSAKADVLLSSNQEAPVQVAVEDGINFGVWYPYESNAGVPPIPSFTARGINITFIQGDLDDGEIAKYDVIFIGRAGAIGQFPSGAGTLDIDALISFVNNGGGLIGESNATIFDSDYWRSVPWSSRLSVVQGISGDQDGYDYAECNLPVSINNPTHPIAHGVASSFILNGCYANKNSARLDNSKNQAAVLVGTSNQSSIVATDFGNGCSVYFPSAVGFGGMDWSANPDYETLFLNAVEYASTCGNQPPIANAAGQNQPAVQGEKVCFDGSGSSDADNDPLTYSWAFTAWPAGSTAELDNPTSDKPCFTADLPGTYKVSLIVNDGNVDSAPSTAEAVVISYHEAINQLCPCGGPKGTADKWKNHGQYVSCVSKSAESFLEAGRITEAEKDAICSDAGQSGCGAKK